ncbi:hypothetical protein HanLR1_Chr16g0641941 [Helianthus annuus]|nr:hypothetical protein HanLR1_Chr16g0641941 [Helianthus annuus]
MNAISPCTILRAFNISVTFPNRTVAFKPTSKPYLPYPISFLHLPFCFHITHLIPQ